MVTQIDFSPLAKPSKNEALLLDSLASYDHHPLLKEEINISLYRGHTFSVLVLQECYDITSKLEEVSSTNRIISDSLRKICFLSHPLVRIQAVENVFLRIVATPVNYGSDTKEIPPEFLPQLEQFRKLKDRFTS